MLPAHTECQPSQHSLEQLLPAFITSRRISISRLAKAACRSNTIQEQRLQGGCPMRNCIIIGLILLMPCMALAEETKCKVIEYPDHVEADCSGDAAASPPPGQKIVPAHATPPAPVTGTNRYDGNEPAPPPEAPQKQDQPANEIVAQPPTQPDQPVSNQGTVTIKHSRQQYQQSLENAKAARRQLILQRLQQQAPPPASAPPAQPGPATN